MSYLVTGGGGFVGRSVIQLLRRDGEKVISYDLDFPQTGSEIDNNVVMVRGDITDPTLFTETCQKYEVDRIIHLAACTSTASEANPILAIKVNFMGMVNILETAKKLGIKKVVWSSSGWVFGPPEKHHQEYLKDDAPHYPHTMYAICKSFNEQVSEYYFRKYGVDVIAVRFCKIYGLPLSINDSATVSGSTAITQEMIIKPALGKPGRVPTGDATLNWLYVEDAARAVILASRTGVTRTRAFNLNGDLRKTSEAIGIIKKLIPEADITLKSNLPQSAGFVVKYDSTRAKEELGFEFKWTLEQGIKKMVDEIRSKQSL